MLPLSKTTTFHWQEALATSLGAITLLAGWHLGTSHHPDWLARAGSLLIVYGVILATTRKFDLLSDKVTNFLTEFRKRNRELIPTELRKIHKREPTCCEVLEAELEVYQSAVADIARLIDDRRRAFKVYEIGLVIVGTLVNGFGPWLLTTMKSAA